MSREEWWRSDWYHEVWFYRWTVMWQIVGLQYDIE